MDKQNYIVKVDSEKLKALRKNIGFTQPEVAAKLGISSGAYQAKETGLYPFKDSEKLMVCELYNMTFEEFDDILYGGALKKIRV